MSDETSKPAGVDPPPAPAARPKGKERFRNNGNTVIIVPTGGRCAPGEIIDCELDPATQEMWLENGHIVRA